MIRRIFGKNCDAHVSCTLYCSVHLACALMAARFKCWFPPVSINSGSKSSANADGDGEHCNMQHIPDTCYSGYTVRTRLAFTIVSRGTRSSPLSYAVQVSAPPPGCIRVGSSRTNALSSQMKHLCYHMDRHQQWDKVTSPLLYVSNLNRCDRRPLCLSKRYVITRRLSTNVKFTILFFDDPVRGVPRNFCTKSHAHVVRFYCM